MGKLKIVKEPDDFLRKKAQKIKDPLDKKIQKLISDMTETMRENNGVGLAAPQVGKSIRLCIIEDEDKRYVLINPTITASSREKSLAEEGCLSCPGKFLLVERPSEVQIRFTDEFGKARKIKCKGLPARVVQHEIDHLDGILIIDKGIEPKKSHTKKSIENAPKKEKPLKDEGKEKKLRTVFMGTSELSEKMLSSLIENGYNIVGIFTKSDKKVGREHELSTPETKKLAEKHNIPVFQPEKFTDDAIDKLKDLDPDIVIVAAYGKIIPKKVLEIPYFGFINVHVSLLPKYRGPSPIQNALLQGEKETGVTIMLMDEGVDTGDILAQEKIPIEDSDDLSALTDKLSQLGAQVLLETIPLWVNKKIKAQPQNHSVATLCQLIEREDGHIYWTEDAESIYNRWRALTPWPGVFSYWKRDNNSLRLKILSIGLQKINPLEKHIEGEVFEIGDDIGVQTADGVIILKKIQLEGKNPMEIREFIHGYSNLIGSVLK